MYVRYKHFYMFWVASRCQCGMIHLLQNGCCSTRCSCQRAVWLHADLIKHCLQMDFGGNGPWVMLRQRTSAFLQYFSWDISMFLIIQTLYCFAAISVLFENSFFFFFFFGCVSDIHSYFWILAFFTAVPSLVSSVKRQRFSHSHSMKLLTNFYFQLLLCFFFFETSWRDMKLAVKFSVLLRFL